MPAAITVLESDDFAAVDHSTKWLEQSVDLSDLRSVGAADAEDAGEPKVKRNVDVEVNGKRFSVSMWVPETAAAPSSPSAPRSRRSGRGATGGGSGSGDVTVPMQGTIVKVLVGAGDTVDVGDVIVVLEAMKMENNVTAEKAGTITEVRVAEGDSVGAGDVVAVIK